MNATKYYCDISTLTAEERGRYPEFEKLLSTQIQSISELPNGYSLSFPMNPKNFTLVAEFVTLESRCCPFLSFSLKANAGEDAGSLSITGPEDAKPFIQAEMGFA